MIRFIINSRYIKMFQFMHDKDKCSMKDISKHTKFHYQHVLTVMTQFQEEGLIKPIFNQVDAEHKHDPGNPYILELTPKGQTTHRLLSMLNRLYLDMGTDKIIKQILSGAKKKVKKLNARDAWNDRYAQWNYNQNER